MSETETAPTTSLRGTAVTARVGVALGIAVTICFVTGLISHFIQHPQPWFFWPTRPVWLYRVTQGLHVISGHRGDPAAGGQTVVGLPQAVRAPHHRRADPAARAGLHPGSGGLHDLSALHRDHEHRQWYAFKFFFTTSHYAMAYVAAGAVLVHLGVKLPVIRRALGEPLEEIPTGALIRTTVRAGARCWAVPGWRRGSRRCSPRARRPVAADVSLLAPRSGQGPQGVPVNRSAWPPECCAVPSRRTTG